MRLSVLEAVALVIVEVEAAISFAEAALEVKKKLNLFYVAAVCHHLLLRLDSTHAPGPKAED
jgi:hypothetical protein